MDGSYSKPIIERYGEDILIDNRRMESANAICTYFENRIDPDARIEYYKAVDYLLTHRDSTRILLYLPFDELGDVPKQFKDSYIYAWYNLLNRYDVRENFHEGDCFELDARPNREVERVVKAAHLTPWMIKAGLISYEELRNIIRRYKDDTLLVQSFRDTIQYMVNNTLLSGIEAHNLFFELSGVPGRKRLKPLYISESRVKWLKEKDRPCGELITPDARLEGPFSPNLKKISTKIEEIKTNLEPNEIVLLGGSQLKGYGTADSDLDIWKLDELEQSPTFYPGNPEAAHIYFDSVWIGGDAVSNVAEVSKEKMNIYIKSDDRRSILERLESDLLQYRLLHKGFSRFTHKTYFETSGYPEMDGDCPFYTDRYRKIATMLYAKYVTIPDETL